MTDLYGLLEYHGAASLDKQWALGDLIGDASWHVVMSKGTITFGGEKSFPIQIIGTESELSRTWLWAWANEASNIPPGLLQAVGRLRAFGAEQGVPELTDEELSLGPVSGHLLAMIAAGVCGADCYYRGPYENGAAFFLLDAPELRDRQSPPTRIINVFMQFISTFEVNHRRAMLAYLQSRGYSCAAEGDALVGSGPLGSVACRFDEFDRFVAATAKTGGDAQ